MTTYAKLLPNGLVDEGLPSNLAGHPDDVLAGLGWKPLVAVEHVFDPDTRYFPNPPVYSDAGDHILCDHEPADMPPEALAARVESLAAPARADRKAAVTALRYDREVGGMAWTLGDEIHRVATDRESQSKLVAAYAAARDGCRADPSVWKMDDGRFVSLTNAEMMALALAVLAHVQACFDAERAHHQAIDGLATAAQVRAYDITAGWPGAVA